MRWWHLASLDAPTVAAVWSLGFSWAAKVRLPFWIPLLLFLATWAVYISDRLLDARAGLRWVLLAAYPPQTSALQERHLFHWRYRSIFAPLAVLAVGGVLWIALYRMPIAAQERESVLAALTAAYFSCIHLRHKLPALLSKELLVGVIFAAACILPTFNRLPAPIGWPLGAVAAFFAAVAWLNCAAIERWESVVPTRKKLSIAVLGSLLGGAGFFLTVLLLGSPRMAALIAAGSFSAWLIAALDGQRTRWKPMALRVNADLVLLTPLFLLLPGIL